MPIRAADVVVRVARKHGVTPLAILGFSRLKKMVKARHEAAYWIRELRDAAGERPSFPQIAMWMKRTDHTSIMYACKRHAWRMARDV